MTPAERYKAICLISLGVISGICSSLFGIGGGLLIVPGLIILFGYDMKRATALSISAVVPITLVSAITHMYYNPVDVDMQTILLLIGGGFAGSWAGVRFIQKCDNTVATRLFAALLVLCSLMMMNILPLFDHLSLPQDPSFVTIEGAIVGTISGFFGISGGVFLVPTLNKVFDIPLKTAITTSLLTIIPTAFMASLLHQKRKNVAWMDMLYLVSSAILGVFIGTILGLYLSDKSLSIAFGVFLIAVAIRLLLTRKKPW